MQGALEEVAGVEDIFVTFDRREAVVRYDADTTNIRELEEAVAASGGYIAGLKYGPVQADGNLTTLATRTEFPLIESEQEFDHTGVFVLPAEQISRTAEHLSNSKDATVLGNVSKDDLVFLVSLWTDSGTNLLIDWWTAAELIAEGEQPKTPEQWIPLTEHTERDGGGSVAGLLVYNDVANRSDRAKFRLKKVGGQLTFETELMPIHN
ncbi:MAG: heavy-metal-associated domain-containing protein [Candidatus Marinimicrobia bacterium]|nr:heavy-metal-associated domain-containing protein [Candidatus Neomarinimicrobiota bacterium]MCF7829776.1 heavy-metal-associated domain-containing protein [Candidatus Neomarinimicrobiota bacterium]MCF7881726.1 heavy-metal-associated domain-containing protein [Candidatus Neomarinimicrobiota bacterium]